MKKGLFTYFIIGLFVTVVGILVLMIGEKASVAFTDYENDKYFSEFKAGEKGVSSPWYEKGLHIVDESFVSELPEIRKDDRNVISIGSSLSIISFHREVGELPSDYKYHFLVCGNGCWKSDGILYKMAKADDALSDDDIIKLEISYSTFRDMDTSITESTASKWKRFKIDENGNVSKGSILLTPVYALNKKLLVIQNSWELISDYAVSLYKKIRGSYNYERIVPGNFRNNYFNYDVVADSCNMTDDMKLYMSQLIEEMSKEHTLVVEISPMPEGLAGTSYGEKFISYVEDELIPMLDEEGIPYFDYRYDYRDDEYADGVHLGYDAGIRYTKRLNEDLGRLIYDR